MKYLLIDIENHEEYQVFSIINKNKKTKVKSFTRFITDIPVVISGEIKDGILISPALCRNEDIIPLLPEDSNAKEYWKKVYYILTKIENKDIRKIVAEEINAKKKKYIYYPLDLNNNITASSLIKRTILLSKLAYNMADDLKANKDAMISISLLFFMGIINNKMSLYDSSYKDNNNTYIFYRIIEKYPKEYEIICKINEMIDI